MPLEAQQVRDMQAHGTNGRKYEREAKSKQRLDGAMLKGTPHPQKGPPLPWPRYPAPHALRSFAIPCLGPPASSLTAGSCLEILGATPDDLVHGGREGGGKGGREQISKS